MLFRSVPTEQYLNVDLTFEGSQGVAIGIFTLEGSPVILNRLGTIVSGSIQEKVNLDILSAGVYFIKIRVGKEYVVQKIIKE